MNSRRNLFKRCLASATGLVLMNKGFKATLLTTAQGAPQVLTDSSVGAVPAAQPDAFQCAGGLPSGTPDERLHSEALKRMGLEPELFVSFWRGTVPFLENGERRAAFLASLVCLLSRVDEPMRLALRELSRLMATQAGRYVITGGWLGGIDWSRPVAIDIIHQMGASVWPWRRRARQGLVILVGLAHYGHPELVKDTGFSGMPEHARHIWD